MKIFVTGSTGFIGSCFIDYALKSGVTIQALKEERIQNAKENWR